MKRTFFFLFFITTLGWCPLSFAARQSAAGPGVTPLDQDGITNGVDMSGSAGTGTLNVGTVGGPETDIFQANNPVGTVPGLAVSTAASSTANIVFNSSSNVYGDIGITNPGGPFFLNISGGNNGATVNFLGSVFGTTLNVTGTGAVNFNNGGTNITATNFAADGTISLAPNTTLIGALTTTAGANTGTLSLGGGSVLDGAVGGAVGLKSINVVGGSNTAGVSSTITGAVDAYSFSLGTNTLHVSGALTIANSGTGGVINTTLASPTVFGNIRPVGTTNLGPTLGVNVAVPSTAFFPVGTQFNIVQTQGGAQSGTNGSVVVVVNDPTNPLYTFAPVPPAGTVAGLVAIQTTGVPILTVLQPPAGTPPVPLPPVVAPLAPVIVAVLPVLPTTVLGPINAISNPVVLASSLAQLSVSAPDLAAPLVTFQGTQEFQNLWLSRLDSVLCDSSGQPNKKNSTCQGKDQDSGWWMKGFGYFGNQDAKDGYEGYSSSIAGLMAAYDMPLDPDTRAGLGLGYARSTIDGNTFDTNTDFNSYQATAYIGHESGPWFVDGNASFGWNDYSGTRNIIFPGTASTADASYSGQDYTAFASTGYHLPAQEFMITPFASLQYTHMNLDGYTETGAGPIDLKVGSQNYDFLESGLGVKVERDFSYDGNKYAPETHLKWLHELSNPRVEQTAALTVAGSPSFTVQGLKPAADTLNIGAGLTLLTCSCSARTWSLEAVYDYYWRDDGYSANQGMIRLTDRF